MLAVYARTAASTPCLWTDKCVVYSLARLPVYVRADAANGKLAQPGAASEPSADASPLVASLEAQPNTETAASTDDGSQRTSQFDHTPLPAIGNC